MGTPKARPGPPMGHPIAPSCCMLALVGQLGPWGHWVVPPGAHISPLWIHATTQAGPIKGRPPCWATKARWQPAHGMLWPTVITGGNNMSWIRHSTSNVMTGATCKWFNNRRCWFPPCTAPCATRAAQNGNKIGLPVCKLCLYEPMMACYATRSALFVFYNGISAMAPVGAPTPLLGLLGRRARAGP